MSGWAKAGILDEFASIDLRNKYFPYFEDPHPEMKTWSARVVKNLMHAPQRRSANLADDRGVIRLVVKTNWLTPHDAIFA